MSELLIRFISFGKGSFRSAAGGRFPAGRELSRFGCASRVSSFPLFPQESATLRCTALYGGRWCGVSWQIRRELCEPINYIFFGKGSFRSATGGRFPAGRELSRFGCASRVSNFPLFPQELFL
ncbi:hypothetical protein ABER02_21920, partial [Rossellomorea marisflavi]|uniref:hypothetical protein n=1 Tax=Rossellomorea marisflavi TaxID=189381 RepID=UPI003D282C75